MPDDAQVDPRRTIEKLKRELDARTAERDEALAQQAAISKIVQIINRSGADLAPVFDAILEKATNLCESAFGILATYDGARFRDAALRGVPAAYSQLIGDKPRVHAPGTGLARAVEEKRAIHIEDLMATDVYRTGDPNRQAMVDLAGARTALAVPLLKDGEARGVITVFRQQVRPFSEQQIALLENFAAQAVIAMENARLLTETREALEQQTATAEVLQVINSSPGDLAPVFDAMLEKALRLCDAAFGNLWTYDGEVGRLAAIRGASPEYRAELMRAGPQKPEPGGSLIRLVEGEPLVHIADITTGSAYRSGNAVRRMLADRAGARTVLWVPLRKEGALLGFFAIYRTEVRPFSDKQIALLQNFAAQAVIAMENARLLTEQCEALERQAATAEVLGIIASSPGRLEPVFKAMLANAVRICAGTFGTLALYDGDGYRGVAAHGAPSSFPDTLSRFRRPVRGTTLDGLEKTLRTVQLADCAAEPAYDPVRAALPEYARVRSHLCTPMIKDNRLLGAILIYRDRVQPFDDKQIELVENFAKQAVIAIDNARLMTETREALDQQTATAEVLQVINSSPGELTPVFDAMLEKALRLCDAAFGALHTFDGEAVHTVALRNVPSAFAEFLTRAPLRLDPEQSLLGKCIYERRTVHVPDRAAEESYQHGAPLAIAAVELGDIRALLHVPLIKDNTALGAFTIYRQEVRPFTDKQIALLQNFAAQAVIAMENARLLTETREALEQQTATAEVLQVINSSPGDLAPVFDAMLDKALHLCEAGLGLLHTYDGERFRALAIGGVSGSAAESLREWVPDPDSALQRIVDGELVVHIPDVVDTEAYRSGVASRRKLVELTGARTALWVALRKDDTLLGVFVIYRREVRPFTDKQIALLQNFAAQAVIAIENARLLTETREALEQQTATAEVLQVINSSPGDLTPVFDAMLEKAMRLCEAEFGLLTSFDGEAFHAAALRGVPASFAESWREPRRPGPGLALHRLTRGENLVHIPDVTAEDAYQSGDPIRRALADLGGARTGLWVALRKDSSLLGAFVIYRKEVRLFSDKQIALLQNFAAQAVIAMENARLLTETREALEQQTATAEVLGVINSSPGDLGPVFDAILEKAHTLCGAAHGSLGIFEGETWRAVVQRGYGEPLASELRQPRHGSDNEFLQGLIDGARFVHIPDLARLDYPIARANVAAGIHTLLVVPLRKEDALLGTISTARREVRPFTDKEIALLENFAAQAVIAMENARLITETREALDQQTATAEVLGVINSSPGDLAPVFDAILEKAHSLCGVEYGALQLYDGEKFHAEATRGYPEGLGELLRRPYALEPNSPLQALLQGAPLVEIPDVVEHHAEAPNPIAEAAITAGIRSAVFLPLRKDNLLLGLISAGRKEAKQFSDKQIALLQNFVAQAVIAIENARLITETREALEQQTATAEVLGVINSSPGDLAPVFQSIVKKAHTLCGAACGSLQLWDGEKFRGVAMRGFSEAMVETLRLGYSPADMPCQRIVEGERVVHCVDLAEIDSPVAREGGVKLGGVGTILYVALRKDDVLLGQIVAARQEVRPFSEKEIALVESFAAQAVIAMENARLITETREALEQQTATAEVLQVINSSPGDLTPVFDAMLEKAMRLCEAEFGLLTSFDGEAFHAAASRGVPASFAEPWREPRRPGPGLALHRLTRGENLVHIPDVTAEDAYQSGDPIRRALADLGGARTGLWVALRKEASLLGAFVIYRKEVRPFTEKQIALLENFAAQAVIAMENARLLTETREALEQQTATAEVLQVINSSPGDLAPVFDAMLERARRLCEPAFGVMLTWDGERFHRVAWRGASPEVIEATREPVIGPPGSPGYRIAHGEEVVSIADLAENEATRHAPAMRTWVRLGVHSYVAVALRKEERLLGAIVIYRLEVRPFTDKEIALLQNFAAQAVIAMENARLLGELRERTSDLEESLEYQTATSDVLQVISRSTFDLQPVLDTLVQTAARLCSADLGLISNREEDGMRVSATFSTTPEYEAFIRGRLLPLTRESLAGRAFVERKAVQIPDLTADPEFTVTETVALAKMRTALGVPLMREGEVIGAISLARQRVEPFTERQIELVRTFADQAVIAIENTRLITETREALEQQTATAEILEVINRSPGDLAPVFDAILEKAHRLCGAALGSLQLYDGEKFRAVAIRGQLQAVAERLRQPRRLGPGSSLWPLVTGQHFVHVPDSAEIDTPDMRNIVKLAGLRTALYVALRKENTLLGFIGSGRDEVRPFSEKEIALLESFAAQAVIAMDNARLLDEIRQRQAELRVTFDNMGDGVAMFDSDQRLAAWNLNFQRILELPDQLLAERPRVGDFVRYLVTHGEYGAVDVEAEVRRLSERVGTQWSAERTRPDGRVIEVRSNPVPGGGVVLIYSDVTERKRAEAEIRAARDTAEKALQELQQAQASLLHAQKMAALGQLTAGIAHEIKNPLNFVNNFAELSGELLLELKETTAPAVAALGDDERAAVDEVVEMLRGNLDKIAEHGKRADGIVKSMLEHSRGVSGERRAVDLNALIEEALNLAYHGARAQDASFNIALEREFDRGLAPTELAPQEMTRVFLNLFGNGFYATAKRQRDGAGSEFRPTLRVATRDFGDAVEVRVRDNGTGIAPEIRDKLFQPFVTTKPTGEGTGLGLSISYDIVTQQHGGTIAVDSREGEFTEFTIRLPRAH